jgi:hypothetical protein
VRGTELKQACVQAAARSAADLYISADLLEIFPVALLFHPTDLALRFRGLRMGAGGTYKNGSDDYE